MSARHRERAIDRLRSVATAAGLATAAPCCAPIAAYSAAGLCEPCARQWWRARLSVSEPETHEEQLERLAYERDHAADRWWP